MIKKNRIGRIVSLKDLKKPKTPHENKRKNKISVSLIVDECEDSIEGDENPMNPLFSHRSLENLNTPITKTPKEKKYIKEKKIKSPLKISSVSPLGKFKENSLERLRNVEVQAFASNSPSRPSTDIKLPELLSTISNDLYSNNKHTPNIAVFTDSKIRESQKVKTRPIILPKNNNMKYDESQIIKNEFDVTLSYEQNKGKSEFDVDLEKMTRILKTENNVINKSNFTHEFTDSESQDEQESIKIEENKDKIIRKVNTHNRIEIEYEGFESESIEQNYENQSEKSLENQNSKYTQNEGEKNIKKIQLFLKNIQHDESKTSDHLENDFNKALLIENPDYYTKTIKNYEEKHFKASKNPNNQYQNEKIEPDENIFESQSELKQETIEKNSENTKKRQKK